MVTALATLQEVKFSMKITTDDRDSELEGLLEGARTQIEALTGPIVPVIFDEKYSPMGSDTIMLRNRPSAALGTTPLLDLIAVSEYRGPIEHPLAIVGSPMLGTIYSVELDASMGTITRRTAAGGSTSWYPGSNSVHVIYRAGQTTVPEVARRACIEAVRANYTITQATGAGHMTVADAQDAANLPFFLPRHCRQMLGAIRRAPSIA